MPTKKQTGKRASKPRPKDLPPAAKGAQVKGGSIGKLLSSVVSAPFKAGTTAT